MGIHRRVIVGIRRFRVGQPVLVADGRAGAVAGGCARADGQAGVVAGRILRGERDVGAGEQHRDRLEADIFLDVVAVRAGRQVRDEVLAALEAGIIEIPDVCTLQVIERKPIRTERYERIAVRHSAGCDIGQYLAVVAVAGRIGCADIILRVNTDDALIAAARRHADLEY